MIHNCKIEPENNTRRTWDNIKWKAQELMLVSASNPIRFGYFKSDLAIKKEKERHLRINRYAIHPFSKFRGMYEVFLVLLYTNALVIKPMCGFLTLDHYTQSTFLREYILVVDFFCWIDIFMTFFTGFALQTEQSNAVELKFGNIARHYILSPYFICDVVSSVPKGMLYSNDGNFLCKNVALSITVDVLMLLKIVRTIPLFAYIYRSAQYLEFKTKTTPFFVCVFLLTAVTIHWSACFQYGVPRVAILLNPAVEPYTWIYRRNISRKSTLEKYNHAFYKSSAYILGIRQTLYPTETPSEYLLGILTYFIGKVLVAFVWLILAMAILNARSIQIKFLELIDQLEEYMRRKKLPLNLRDRISQYYHFKYQSKYFKEGLIKSLLPDNIKKEVTMHICKTMIKNVPIFSDLTNEEISSMVEHLVSEIFLPQDTIIQHGTYGDAMYFLSSGTVAVYTRSGKEICHLQDGAYFGEISLLLPDQTRNASIVAIETSHVYRLNKRDFERYLLRNKKVLEKIMQGAEERLREATLVEEMYKKLLFEQTFQMTRFTKK